MTGTITDTSQARRHGPGRAKLAWAGVGVVALLVLLVSSVTFAPRPFEDLAARDDVTLAPMVEVVVGNDTVLLQPWTELVGGEPRLCLDYKAPGLGGMRCFVAGWAVETATVSSQDDTVLVVVTHPAVVRVTVPTVGGRTIELFPEPMTGVSAGLATLVLDETVPDLVGNNTIEAFAADGTKLGNQHYLTDAGDFGPWDGSMDRDARPESS